MEYRVKKYGNTWFVETSDDGKNWASESDDEGFPGRDDAVEEMKFRQQNDDWREPMMPDRDYYDGGNGYAYIDDD